MQRQPVAGFQAYVSTHIAYAAMPVELTTDVRTKLVVLCGPDKSLEASSSRILSFLFKQDYPQDQWVEYCTWLNGGPIAEGNELPKRIVDKHTVFVVASYWSAASKVQHRQMLEWLAVTKREMVNHRAAILMPTGIARPVRSFLANAASTLGVAFNVPMKLYDDDDLESGLEYLRVRKSYDPRCEQEVNLYNVQGLVGGLHRAIDRRRQAVM